MSEGLEEHYFRKDRKSGKKERKEASARDRSKFKKTDREKWLNDMDRDLQLKMENKDFLRGRVLSIVPLGYMVEHEGNNYQCVLRGLLKKEKRQIKNIVTVGDMVLFEPTTEGEGVIAYVEPRKSVLSRQDAQTRRSEHILAANIDQVLIIASVVNPNLKPSLVDRYIIAARKGNMDPVVVVNKIDLLDDPDQANEKSLYEFLLEAYRLADIPVIAVSALNKEGINELRAIMKDKSSVFSGQSGVGKSSLINEITGLDLPTGEVIEKTRKGIHTTTLAQLIPLDCGGFCVDTPGIKSFGVWDLQKDEIEGYYSEIYRTGRQCKYPNCSHIVEEDCAVQQAVENGEISPIRYETYAELVQTIDEEQRRR